MKAPERVGMTVNGQRMGIENYLLNVIERPLPKAPTHYVLAEILNTDLSVKRITVYFNPDDTWYNNTVGKNHPNGVGMDICDGLAFLGRDPNTLAFKTYIIEIASNEIVQKGVLFNCSKCEV